MIIWGWRTLKGTAAKGEFHCPHCAARRPYNHEKLRRWFTLYFIPAIPVGSVDEQVTCGQCRKSWQMSVLAHDPDKQKAEQIDRIGRDWLASMAAVAVSRGGPTPEVAQAIVADIESITGRRIDPAEVTKAAAGITAPVADATIVGRLGSLANELSSSGQERFLTSVLRILRMLSNCGPAEIETASAIGRALGISEAHAKGILLQAGLGGG